MNKLVAATLGFVCLGANATGQSDTYHNLNHATNLINVWLEAEKDYENIPSITGFVVDDQQTLWTGAFGHSNRSTKTKMTEDTRTSICSTSKVFTATAVMKLIDEGVVNLDDDIKKWVPELTLKSTIKDGGPVTVRSLLSHTSGLPRDTNHSYWSGPDHTFPTEAQMFESLAVQSMVDPVGKTMSYGNVNYALLGAIVARASGMSYKRYMEQEFFKPLKMNDSVVELPVQELGSRHALGYSAKGRSGERKQANQYQTRAMQSAAGISTTVNDLTQFVKWQFRLADGEKRELLSPETLNSMYQSHGKSSGQEPDRGYGYVVYTDKNKAQWAMHGGMCPGYVNFLKMDVSNKRGYGILVNANGVRALKYVNGVIDILKKFEQAPKSTKAQQKELEQYTGFYDLNPWNSEYYVTPWGSDLMLMYLPAGNVKYSMYQYRAVGEDTFHMVNNGQVSQSNDDILVFHRDAKGKVVSVTNGNQLHPRLGR